MKPLDQSQSFWLTDRTDSETEYSLPSTPGTGTTRYGYENGKVYKNSKSAAIILINVLGKKVRA